MITRSHHDHNHLIDHRLPTTKVKSTDHTDHDAKLQAIAACIDLGGEGANHCERLFVFLSSPPPLFLLSSSPRLPPSIDPVHPTSGAFWGPPLLLWLPTSIDPVHPTSRAFWGPLLLWHPNSAHTHQPSATTPRRRYVCVRVCVCIGQASAFASAFAPTASATDETETWLPTIAVHKKRKVAPLSDEPEISTSSKDVEDGHEKCVLAHPGRADRLSAARPLS